jgi:hypothetical protein
MTGTGKIGQVEKKNLKIYGGCSTTGTAIKKTVFLTG